jgi:hypothetical protein
MNIALADDVQELLRTKVANGQFPNEETLVNEVLRQFLTALPRQEHSSTSPTLEYDEERLPGPFIEDETVLAPVDLPRPGRVTPRTALPAARREPDFIPGE